MAMAFLCSFFGILTSDLRPDDQVILALMVSILTLLNFIGFAFLHQNKSASLIFALLTTYIWVAYPVQLLMTLHNPQSAEFLLEFFRPGVIQNELLPAFYTVFPGIIALFAGLLIGRNIIPNNFSTSNYVLRHNFFISIILCLIFLKVFIQTFWEIGLPGVSPQALPIPFLVGFLELLTRPTLFAIVNLYFYSVLRLKERKGILIAVSLLLINVLLALRVGYKTELALQGFLIAYYMLDVHDLLSKTRRRLISILTLLSIVSLITLYPLVSVYRNNLLSEKDFSEAIAETADASEKDTSSTLHSILDRINGIRVFYLAIKLGSNKDFSLISLFNQDVQELIKERLYGRDKDNAITAYGTTQLSVLYLIGGVPFLVFGCLIMGWAIRWTSTYTTNHIFLYSITFDAYLPFFCVLWVKILASGGLIPLYMKELALGIGCLFVIERICYAKKETIIDPKLSNAPVRSGDVSRV